MRRVHQREQLNEAGDSAHLRVSCVPPLPTATRRMRVWPTHRSLPSYSFDDVIRAAVGGHSHLLRMRSVGMRPERPEFGADHSERSSIHSYMSPPVDRSIHLNVSPTDRRGSFCNISRMVECAVSEIDSNLNVTLSHHWISIHSHPQMLNDCDPTHMQYSHCLMYICAVRVTR